MEILDRIVEQILALPPWAHGLALGVSTLISEDLACIAAGLLAASGKLSAATAIGSTAIGIWVGDLILFWLGSVFGRRLLRVAPFSWILHEEDLDIAAQWFSRKGVWVIWATRFIPGTRLASYVCAGMFGMRPLAFALATLLAVAVWTPLVCGASMAMGTGVLRWLDAYREWVWPVLLIGVLLLFVLVKFAIPSFTWRGRRMVLSRWYRMTRWEFWPMWLFYLPVFAYIVWLALRHRSLSVMTAVNPGLPAGGFVGESKIHILESLRGAEEHLPRSCMLQGAQDAEQRLRAAQEFLNRYGLSYPVILKPDAGQRGSGVVIARNAEDVRRYLQRIQVDCLVQEFVAGDEFGVFYYRFPQEREGRIFSITRKEFPSVVGDGLKNIERLILEHPRAVCMARFFLERNCTRLFEVPAAGERVQLVDIGNHCRGAVFFDGSALITPQLTAIIDRISRGFEGFYFGRYDVRVPGPEQLREGRGIKIIELNGATSEATSIYDPSNGLGEAYRTLFQQWRILFAIASENRRRGASEVHWSRWPGLLARYRAGARSHPHSVSS